MTIRPIVLAFLSLTFAAHAQTPAQKALITAIGTDQKTVVTAPVATLNTAIGKLNTDTNALIATITVTPPIPPIPPTGTLPLDAMGGAFSVAECYQFWACDQASANAGKLAYQVKRRSDGKTQDVPLLASGFANDALALSLCGNSATTCNVWLLYGQKNGSIQRQVPNGTETPLWVPNCAGPAKAISCMSMSDPNTLRMLSDEKFPTTDPQPYSASYVAAFTNVFNNDQFVGGTTSQGGWRSGFGHRAGGGVMVDDDDNYLVNPMPDDGLFHSVQSILNGGSSSVKVDGGVPTLGSITTNNGLISGQNALHTLQVGASKDYGYVMYGNIGGLRLFNKTILTATQQANLRNSDHTWAGTP